jgi:hypothetical protein
VVEEVPKRGHSLPTLAASSPFRHQESRSENTPWSIHLHIDDEAGELAATTLACGPADPEILF